MKALSLSILFFFLTQGIYGQYTIQGKVLEESSQLALDYATVVVYDLADTSVITGATSENGGVFSS